MATGIEIKDLPEIPLTGDTKMLCQNADGTGSATLMNAREAIGVAIDRAGASFEVVDAGTDPSVTLDVLGTEQHKEFDFSFALPRATRIKSFVAETEVLEADGEPGAEIVEGGDANEREYTLKLALGKSTEITGVTATGVVQDAGTEPSVTLAAGGTPSRREYGLTFGLPRATAITGVTAETEVLEADGEPTVSVEEGGSPNEREYAFKFALPRAVDISGVTAEAEVVPAGEAATAEVTQGGTASGRTLHFAFGIPKGDPGVIEGVTAEIVRGAPDSESAVEITQGGSPSVRTYHLKFSLPEVPAVVPVGFVYVQFPGQDAPDAVFGGTWENISAEFAGRFFRAEGGNAAGFGTPQPEGLPNITGYMSTGSEIFDYHQGGALYKSAYSGKRNVESGSRDNVVVVNIDASRSSAVYGKSSHVTPENYAVRIWKRTA